MAYENQSKETTKSNEGSYIDGIVADYNEFGLTADDLQDIADELYEMNHRSKEWGMFDDD